MTTEQAIQILNEQITSLRWVSEKTSDSWKTQTQSIIKDMFGFASPEYTYISTFAFSSFYGNLSISSQISESKTSAIDYLERCIVTIQRKNLFKPPAPVIKYVDRPVVKEIIKEVLIDSPKVNNFRSFIKWLRRKDTLALIGTGLTVLGLPFALGWFLAGNRGDIKNSDLRRENKQLIIDTSSLGIRNRQLLDTFFSIKTILDVAKTKTVSDTQRNHIKQKPDITHK